MKKALLPLAIAALMPVSAFAVGPIDGTVYGKINLTVENYDDGTDTVTEMNSNASRFGLQGKSELSEGLYAIYKIEWEVDATGEDTELGTRNRYIGLSGGFGTVIAGAHDTPHKLAQNKVDLFNDLSGDIKNALDSENRAKNVVIYTSPSAAGFAISGAWAAAEDADEDDGASISISYDQSGLYLAAAFESDIEAQGTDSTRLVAQYKVGDLQLGALWEENDVEGMDTQDAMHVSAAYKIDKITLKAQYSISEISASKIVDSGISGDEGEMWSLGADYKLGKKTKVFAFYTTMENDENTIEKDFLGVGMEHKF